MTTNQDSQVLYARQPIYDPALELAGFELLFRSNPESNAAPDQFDENAATSQVLINAFSEGDIDQICSQKPAFVNFTADTLAHGLPFSPSRLVVEVLETVEPTAENIATLEQLREAGYRIAIDDYIRNDKRHPLLAYADILKLEYPAFSAAGLMQTCNQLTHDYPSLTLLAEKIETREEFDIAHDAGCHLFQGYFLARPEVVHGQPLSVDRFSVVQLLAALNDPNASIEQITDAIRNDPVLSVRLLKLVNTAQHFRQITSLQMAVMALGTVRIHAYANLLALSRLSEKPSALQQLAATRGFICQQLCEHLVTEPETGFTVGLFSCLNALFNRQLNELLETIPLNQEITRALLHHEGPLGIILNGVIAHEQGRLAEIPWGNLAEIGINRKRFMAAFEQGVSLAGENSL